MAEYLCSIHLFHVPYIAFEYYLHKPQRVLSTLFIVLDSSRKDNIASSACYQRRQMAMYQMRILMPARYDD